jgi:creatinine amidohydrolase
MADLPAWGRYAELRPEQIDAVMAAAPIAYVPWGALEWHGPHLPFGTEGYIAEAVAERAAQRTGGVVLPATWGPITALPHRLSLSIRSEIIHELWDALFAELARAGFQTVVVLTGHNAPGHSLLLMDAAEHAIATYGICVLAVPPLALVDEQMADHAGHWETALMLALHPRMTAVEALDGRDLGADAGVIGEEPYLATAGQGESALLLAAERVAQSVRALAGATGPVIVRELYARRRALAQAYVERYFQGSWEEAQAAWWRDHTAQRERSLTV